MRECKNEEIYKALSEAERNLAEKNVGWMDKASKRKENHAAIGKASGEVVFYDGEYVSTLEGLQVFVFKDGKQITAYNWKIEDALYDEVLHVSTPIERRNIQKMDERLRNYQLSLDQKYLLFCIQVEGSEAEFMQTLKATDVRFASVHRRADASAKHARTGGVKEEKIIHSTKELDEKFGKRERKGLFGLFKKKSGE